MGINLKQVSQWIAQQKNNNVKVYLYLLYYIQ